MKKSVYIVGGVLVVGVIAIALMLGFSRNSGLKKEYAGNSNTTTLGPSGNSQPAKKPGVRQ